MIKSLEIFNYKSFLHEKIIFGNQLNLIGRNDLGKSNIYGAMKFLFSIHDYDKIQPEEKRGILNNKLIENEVLIEVVIKNDKKNQVLNADEFCLKKEINKNDKIIYYLNGSIINKDLYKNLLLCSKIASFSQLKFLSAKNINKIGNMTGEEIYQLVKSLTGATIYEENKESSLHILEKTDEEQNKVKELLVGLEEKIEFLKEKKSKFQVYEKENEKIDWIKKLLFERELHNGKLVIL